MNQGLALRAVGGCRVLITGAGGSIGSGLAQAVMAGRPGELVLVDSSESALYQCWRSLSEVARGDTELVPVTGSVADAAFLGYLLRRKKPEVIFHAAAYKHVALMEGNPFSALANNSVGTYRLVAAAREAGVERLISVSTDKAVNPASVMGASKRIAELAALSHSTPATRINVIRLCNVLGSSGSVATIFREQAAEGRPLTVTDEGAERYFLLQTEAESAILQAAASAWSGKVMIPDCGEAFRIAGLARKIAIHDGRALPSVLIGLRAGEKLREELWSSDEVTETESDDGLRVMASPHPTEDELARSMQRLERALGEFDLGKVMSLVSELVPAYRWSGGVGVATVKAGVK